jgi:hypothetical protein
MLLAEVASGHAAFRRIWQWTRSHLRLGNGATPDPASTGPARLTALHAAVT